MMRDGRRKSTFYTTSNHLPGLLPMASGSKGHILENVSSCIWAELSDAVAAKSTRAHKLRRLRRQPSPAQPRPGHLTSTERGSRLRWQQHRAATADGVDAWAGGSGVAHQPRVGVTGAVVARSWASSGVPSLRAETPSLSLPRRRALSQAPGAAVRCCSTLRLSPVAD